MNLYWTAVDASLRIKGIMIMVALTTIVLHSVLLLTVFLFWGHFEDIIKVSFSVYEASGNDTILCNYKSSPFS